MKHSYSIVGLLCMIFFFAQVFGLFSASYSFNLVEINQSSDSLKQDEAQEFFGRTIKENIYFITAITAGIIIASIIVLILNRFNKQRIWRIWYGFAVLFCVYITLSIFFNRSIALSFALIAMMIKLSKRHLYLLKIIIEILIYTGIAIIFSFNLTPFWAFILLLIISIYDYLAVFRLKHMITIAEFQKKTGAFSGIMIGYKDKKEMTKDYTKEDSGIKKDEEIKKGKRYKNEREIREKTAILGGGDIVFPLIYNISFFQWASLLFLSESLAFLATSIIALIQTLSIFLLLILGKQNKYYPAMPFLTASTFLGSILILALI
ncbi:MAG: hypothetical protein PWQ28_546 [Candidatus Woesearchaeota archaeon]|nr:hypothetical protein [Candidatus Woesearchaeota archaeon]